MFTSRLKTKLWSFSGKAVHSTLPLDKTLWNHSGFSFRSIAFAGFFAIAGFCFQEDALAADRPDYATRCNEYKQALFILNQDIQAGYSDASIFELRGDVYKAMGELDLALSDYNRAAELNFSELTIGAIKASSK